MNSSTAFWAKIERIYDRAVKELQEEAKLPVTPGVDNDI